MAASFGFTHKGVMGMKPNNWALWNASLKNYCRALAKTSWDAEDLAQDTWLKALGGSLEGGHANPQALLMRIAKHTWIDQQRRRSAWERLLTERYAADRGAQAGKGQGEAGEQLEVELAMHALIQALSPLQRAVLLMREGYGLSTAETAKRLQLTEGAVKAALHRANRALREIKDKNEGEESYMEWLEIDEGSQLLARQLANAYMSGDIQRVVRLALAGADTAMHSQQAGVPTCLGQAA